MTDKPSFKGKPAGHPLKVGYDYLKKKSLLKQCWYLKVEYSLAEDGVLHILQFYNKRETEKTNVKSD